MARTPLTPNMPKSTRRPAAQKTPEQLELVRVTEWITDQCQNNDVADDEEIIDLIAGDTTALPREVIAKIVTTERPNFFRDMWHEIDFTSYGL